MKVKVVRVDVVERPKSYINYTWKCPECGTDNEERIADRIVVQYVVKNLGVHRVKFGCSHCPTRSEIRLVFEN